MKGTSRKWLAATSALFCLGWSPAFAEVKSFNVPAQPLQNAINAFGHQAAIQIIAARKDTAGKRSNAVIGQLSIDDALAQLLGGTGLSDRRTGPETYIVVPTPQDLAPNAHIAGEGDVGLAPGPLVTAEPNLPVEVTIKGIRGSLQSAEDVKQKSVFLVDAIEAEDVGKYPDANAAESLQRVPGIAIAWANGEGQRITVRGFGPQFNTVLWNGRQLATESGGRAFDFDILPSNLLGRTLVYKSADVSLQEGAIGATVNLQTLRPLGLNPTQAVYSAGGLYDMQAEAFTPQAFGFFSHRSADRRFGVLLAVSYQDRKDESRYATTNTWTPIASVLTAADMAPGQAYDPNARYFGPEKLTNDIVDEDRRRLGLSATVQWKPSDGLLFTLDGLFDRYSVKTDGIEAAWYNGYSHIVPGSVYVDAHNYVTRYAYVGNPEFVKFTQNRPTRTFAVGLDMTWHVSSAYTTTIDVSSSSATDADGGKDQYFVIHGPNVLETYTDRGGYTTPIAYDGAIVGYDSTLYPTGSAQLQAAQPVGADFDRNNPNQYRSWWTNRQGNTVEDQVTQARWDNSYAFDRGAFDRVRFGAEYSSEKMDDLSIDTNDVGWSSYGATGIPLPASLFHADNRPGFLSNADTPFTGKFLDFSGEALVDYLTSPQALALRDQVNGLPPGTSAAQILPRGYTAVNDPANSSRVQEDVWAVYAELDFHGRLGALPYEANIGARYSATRETSLGAQPSIVDITPDYINDDYNIITSATPQPVNQHSHYADFLPSANIKLNLDENLILRLAASRTLTRPELSQLNPVMTFPATVRRRDLIATGGNGSLKPYTSSNYDLALEWYVNATTYMSLAIYDKRIDGYIVQAVVPTTFTILNSQHVNEDGISGTSATFDVTRNVNLGSANVSGVELAVQAAFTMLPGRLKYTGATLSIVLPHTNRGFDTSSYTNNNAFPGLSNSYYATLYYDDRTVEARVSWSHRDTYFEGMNTDTEPTYVTSASYVDARLAYNLNRSVQIYASGVNLTNQGQKTVGRYANDFLDYQQTGRRFEIGARVKY